MSATPVNKEAIRVLVLQHGQREAARIAGLNENTVRSWALRYKWSTPNSASKVQPNGHSPLVERIADELAEAERETKLSLARSVKHLAKKTEKTTLKQSGNVKNVAQTAAIVHRWDQKDQASGNVVVNVAILGISPEEVRAEVIDAAEAH
jgi:uncharacterized protein YjcR